MALLDLECINICVHINKKIPIKTSKYILTAIKCILKMIIFITLPENLTKSLKACYISS